MFKYPKVRLLENRDIAKNIQNKICGDLNHCAFKETSMMSVIKYWMNSFHLFRYMMESSTKS